MNSLFIILGMGLVTMFFFLQSMLLSSKLKRLQAFLGKDFIETVTKGGDGILLTVIDETGDGDFKFAKYNQKDDRFVWVEFTEGDKKKKYHYKIPKKDTFTVRNRFKAAIILKESMRALNPTHLATFSDLDSSTKEDLLEDYEEYHALKESYNKLTKKLALTQEVEEIKRIVDEMAKIRAEMKKLKEKWSKGIIQAIDKEKTLLIQDEDDDYVRIYRSINLDEIDDTVTGVHPTEIQATATRIFLDWYQEALERFGRALAVAKARAQQASTMKWILLLGGGIIGLLLFLRMLGG